MFETIILCCVGVGLAASCGFRVFVPMLVGSIAAHAGLLNVSEDFQWMASWTAITLFAIATVVEIGAYYLPWLDNLLDSISIPVSMIAGVTLALACFGELDPWLRWSMAVIVGGGTPGTINLGVSGIRAGSTLITAGTANPVVSTVEWVSALLLSVMAIVIPVVAAVVTILLVIFLMRFAIRFVAKLRQGRQSQSAKPID